MYMYIFQPYNTNRKYTASKALPDSLLKIQAHPKYGDPADYAKCGQWRQVLEGTV